MSTANGFDAIVVGSGLGGLTAAALLSQAGLRVLVLERADRFGGAATTYTHGGLTIEASLHEMSGSGPEGATTEILRALGVLDDVPLVPVGDFYEVRSPLLDGPFVMPHGLDAARDACLRRFPARADRLREYFRLLLATSRAVETTQGEHTAGWWLTHAPVLPWRMWPLLRHMHAVLADVFDRLFGEDEGIKLALSGNIAYYTDDPGAIWFVWWAMAQAGYLAGGGHYVRGGSQVLSDRLAEAVVDAGGACEASRTVTRILVDDDGRVAGVEHVATADGDAAAARQDLAPLVLGNASPHALAEMLPPERRAGFMARYAGLRVSGSVAVVSLGFDRPPSDFGVRRFTTAVFPDWLARLGQLPDSTRLLGAAPAARTPYYLFTDYSQLAAGPGAPGMTLAQVSMPDRIDNWEGLDGPAYDDRRRRWIEHLLGALDREYPGIAGAVVHREMATARTMRDHLGTPGGAILGFAPVPPSGHAVRPNVETSVEGLLLASAFTFSGGFEGAIGGGALAARHVLAHRREQLAAAGGR